MYKFRRTDWDAMKLWRFLSLGIGTGIYTFLWILFFRAFPSLANNTLVNIGELTLALIVVSVSYQSGDYLFKDWMERRR